MSFQPRGHNAVDGPNSAAPALPNQGFDMVEWHKSYQSCQRFFLNHGQHEEASHMLVSFLNIKLPCQRTASPIFNSTGASSATGSSPQGYFPRPINPSESTPGREPLVDVSLYPYIRRLIVTGFATSEVLHGLFGDQWEAGVGCIVEEERRNYLFIAKAASWDCVKSQYDLDDGQSVPRLKPLDDATDEEIMRAESEWSNWILMQDWMVGSRAPLDS